GREPVYQELLHVQTPPLQPNYPRTPSGWKRLTAFNPGGRDATTRANLRAHHALLHRIDVAGLPWWPAVGGDPSGAHAEPGAAVVGMDDAQARAMGHRFGHDAVFAWSPSSWRLLSCADPEYDTTAAGWHAALLRPPALPVAPSPVGSGPSRLRSDDCILHTKTQSSEATWQTWTPR
ncbi:DUF3293 domain-containing protein, partial [Streptomyces sp. NPDC006207]